MLKSPEIRIRTATRYDLESMTDLHCACFSPDEHVPMMLGRHYVAATYRWLVTSGISYVLVAELEGKIIGLVAVCDHSYTKPMFIACCREFILSITKNPLLLTRKKLWQRLMRNPERPTAIGATLAKHPDVAQITIGAIDNNFRGMQVFPRLIEATKEESRQRGSRAIRVGVYKTNLPSRRVFIKGGWVEVAALETTDTVFYLAYLDQTIAQVLGLDGASNPPPA